MTETEGRRGFLTSILMWGGLALGCGIGAFHFIRYLVPMDASEAKRLREHYKKYFEMPLPEAR